MANVQQDVEQILAARYGEEVRGSIADAILAMNDESEEAHTVAIDSQTSAQNNANAALLSATNAKASENAAKVSETNAKESETKAKASETASKTSEDNAKASETASKTSEDNAKISETNAKASETASKTSETNANASMNSALQSATSASSSATAASNSQTAASNSASAAKTSEDNARQYAEQASAIANIDVATTSRNGISRPDGSSIAINQFGVLSAIGLTEHIDSKLSDDNGIHGTRIYTDPTTPTKHILQMWDDTASNWVDVAGALDPATKTTIGGVIIGDGINVDSTGKISVQEIDVATKTKAGIVKVGDGISVTSGTISANFGNDLEYDEDNSKLKLKNGDTVLAEVEIAGGATSMIRVTTEEETWKGSSTVTVKIYDDTKTYSGNFDASGMYQHKVTTTGIHKVEVIDGDDTFEKTVEVVSVGAVYTVSVAKVTWGYVAWLESIGKSATSYADLNAVFADEKLVRELMTRHASVDYLVEWFEAVPSDKALFLANTTALKWIGLRDYAYDKMPSDFIASWLGGDNWELALKDKVPVMTANDAPYGTASAYQVFDGTSSSASGTSFSYKFTNPICARKFVCSASGGTLSASNDGTIYTDISTPNDNSNYYLYYKVTFASSTSVSSLQFYGRSLSMPVPTMTSNTTPSGECSSNKGNETAYKAFDNNLSTTYYSDAYVKTNKGTYIQYAFNKKVIVKSLNLLGWNVSTQFTNCDFILKGSNDGTDFETLGTITNDSISLKHYAVNNNNEYAIYRLECDGVGNYKEGTRGYAVLVRILQFYGLDYSEREFAEGSTIKYIYDHGVELETLAKTTTSLLATLDTTSYTLLRATDENKATTSDTLKCGTGTGVVNGLPNNNYLDVTSVNGSNATGFSSLSADNLDNVSFWLE